VAAMRAGASDFVMKPWRNERLVATLETALELRRRRRQEAAPLREPTDSDAPILGESPAIQRVRDLIRRVAPTDAPVLIHGEAGTGKSLLARTLHLRSARSGGPFVSIDLETETDLAGAFAEARGGTLFLDEVGALSPAMQARLLAALEGPLDIRVVAATRRRREDLRARGGLRDDLLYRLNTVEIFAPPLRERSGDAVILAEHFLRLFAQRHGRPVKPLTREATAAIAENPWPGDVRALRQAMERCVIFADGERYELADIPLAEPAADVAPTLVRSERALVAEALKSNGFNVSHAARQLGITRAALYRRMAKHGL
jgi:DNA-binding NtrC family response regulator